MRRAMSAIASKTLHRIQLSNLTSRTSLSHTSNIEYLLSQSAVDALLLSVPLNTANREARYPCVLVLCIMLKTNKRHRLRLHMPETTLRNVQDNFHGLVILTMNAHGYPYARRRVMSL